MKIATLALAATILVPSATMFPRSPQHDVPAEVASARAALKGAQSDLERAGNEWGGHRAQALKHIHEALVELNEAENWAMQHHDVK